MSTEDPMAAVRQYIDGFNKSDVEVMAATFAVPGAVLDGMAPHLWQGGQQPHRTGIATC